MNQWLEECRWLFNYLLEERRKAWEESKKRLYYYNQTKALPLLKKERPSLSLVYSQILQNVAARVDLAFKHFFRRVRNGEKPGYPRFKGVGRYRSLTYPQFGFKINGDRLHLSGIGEVKIVLHRPLGGKVKTCTIKRTATGKWYAIFACEVKPTSLPESSEVVALDMGLRSFITLSTGERVDAPRPFRYEEKELAKAQRKLSRLEKGSQEYERQRKVVARIHERIAWKRHDFTHQLSRVIINRFGIIIAEDIQVNRMVRNHCLSKSILDVAWSGFLSKLVYKAEEAGRKLIKVNPAYTSQDCSGCGYRQSIPLSEMVFKCPCCGLELDRDYNAVLNILRLGLQSLGESPKSPTASVVGSGH
jgi:putative transposase